MPENIARRLEELADPAPDVRTEAILALSGLSGEQPSWEDIHAAASGRSLPFGAILRRLEEALLDDREAVRLGAVRLLSILVLRLSSSDPSIDARSAFFSSARLLQDPSPRVRQAAAFAVASLDPSGEDSVPLLMKALDDESDTVRSSAVAAMSPASPLTLDLCVKALRDDSSLVRAQAVRSLASAASHVKENSPATGDDGSGALGIVRAAEALERTLGDPEPAVRFGAAITLLRFRPGAEEAIPVLEEMLADEEAGVRVEGALTLIALRPDDRRSADLILRSLREANREQLFQLLLRLAQSGCRDDGVIAELRKLLADEEFRFRIRAATALVQAGVEDEAVLGTLREGIASRDPYARVEAVYGLGMVRGESMALSVPLLENTLDDDSWIVRLGAVSALGEIGPEARGALPALHRALEDELEAVRRAASQAIARVEREG